MEADDAAECVIIFAAVAVERGIVAATTTASTACAPVYRLDHTASPFVEMDIYGEGAEPVDIAVLAGRPCLLAADLSSSDDLTVVITAFRDGDNYLVFPWFFGRKENLRKR